MRFFAMSPSSLLAVGCWHSMFDRSIDRSCLRIRTVFDNQHRFLSVKDTSLGIAKPRTETMHGCCMRRENC